MFVLDILFGIIILALIVAVFHITGLFVQRMFNGFWDGLPTFVAGFLTFCLLFGVCSVAYTVGSGFLFYLGVK
jgi:hypothetical protein